MSQQALAMAAGLSISIVSQMEQGTKTDPRISTVQALARALNTTVENLVGLPATDTHAQKPGRPRKATSAEEPDSGPAATAGPTRGKRGRPGKASEAGSKTIRKRKGG
jgi:transcriptional regulator with XRE-family HTH domain